MPDQEAYILLVEDDKIDREAVHRLLDDVFLIKDAADGQQALKMIDEIRPDGILLDFHLPDYDGLELLRHFAKQQLPVVILTGEESPELVVETMRNGAQDYLVKERISKMALKYALTNAIDRVAMERDLKEKQIQLMEQATMLETQNQEIRRLASQLSLVEQRERRRIAQILHDELQQTIYGIQVQMHLITMHSLPETLSKTKSHLEIMGTLINQAIEVTRSLAVQLSPPIHKSEGLGPTLDWLVEKMQEIHHLTIELTIDGQCRVPDEDLRLLIFQFVQELLFNIVKHAGVNDAKLDVTDNDRFLIIRVEDNGAGFEVEPFLKSTQRRGFGLRSVKERLELFGGRLEIYSKVGDGTQVVLVVPKMPETLARDNLAQ